MTIAGFGVTIAGFGVTVAGFGVTIAGFGVTVAGCGLTSRVRSEAGPPGYQRPMPSDPDYAVVDPDRVENPYDGSDVPGEFRRLTEALGCRQLAVTMIRVPPHSDFEQGTGHFHDEVEELYLLTRGTLTMRFGDQVQTVHAPAAVRVAPNTPRSHRNEGDAPAEMWAVSRRLGRHDATKIDGFWEASSAARQTR